jgi:YfiH family protein
LAATRIELIRPDWPAPTHVHALATTRHGGFSSGPYASLNLGAHVGDDARLVDKNRHALDAALGIETAPSWLDQMHGTRIVAAESIIPSVSETFVADASITSENHMICAIMTADCLPVLLTDRDGLHVAAAHAGWRGLVAGVLENTVGAFVERGVSTGKLIAWLGPAISSGAYEVDTAVVDMLRDDDQPALLQTDSQHWQFDLYALARLRLAACGVAAVFGGGMCTFAEPERFFSYRRDGVCGRQATLIWIE